MTKLTIDQLPDGGALAGTDWLLVRRGTTTYKVAGSTISGDSGGDADTLNGLDSTAFARAVHAHAIGDVTGLQSALDGKQATIAAGTTAQYWRGDKSWQDLAGGVRAVALTGLSTATNATITATDTVLTAPGKLQAQITGHVGSGGAAHAAATTAAAGFMSSADKTKLDGIAAGAQVNAVTSVAGKTGAVTLAKGDVGLGNVDNTSDANKPVSTAQQTALNAKLDAIQYTAADVLAKLKTVDGAGSGLDADLLDGQDSAFYRSASNLNAGTVPDARLPARLGAVAATITDWNAATSNGWYMASNGANAPVASTWFIGHVENHGAMGWCSQTVHAFSTDAEADTKTYRREQNNGTWGAWYRLRVSEAEQTALYLLKGGGTLTGKLTTTAPTTSGAGLTLPHGTTPTTLVNGDTWTTTAGMYVRLNGFTRDLYHAGNLADVSQTEAEAGTATTRRAWTAQRVRQAVAAYAPSKAEATTTAAGLLSSTDKTKLNNLPGKIHISQAQPTSSDGNDGDIWLVY